MTAQKLANWMEKTPIVAILRGVKPTEAEEIAAAVFRAGIGVIEVPLNSPEPLDSIEKLVASLGDRCVIGAGTVLTVDEVSHVAKAGGEIIVSPNTNTDVISHSVKLGLAPMPGWSSASEAFAAYRAGARYLKLFPASTFGPGHVNACRAVLPADANLLAVGGAGADNMSEWLDAGVLGFGIGSEIFKPGFTSEQVYERSARAVAALQVARGG